MDDRNFTLFKLAVNKFRQLYIIKQIVFVKHSYNMATAMIDNTVNGLFNNNRSIFNSLPPKNPNRRRRSILLSSMFNLPPSCKMSKKCFFKNFKMLLCFLEYRFWLKCANSRQHEADGPNSIILFNSFFNFIVCNL